ncbi:MucR family transcriptional regulator [Allosphingosinicella deserti]|uniref:MucR family transcriptional regulator n=1 Tax=Allosphingosinicella deserti TaxID=2116704 RepID=A0A2P7QZF2_9SPHN|nr:MucR family transcriptional regulator [Sphingomonas deserti]
MAQDPALIELTADVVAAHVSNNKVAIGDVATLVANVHAALSTLGAPAPPPEPEKIKPAVSVRASIKPEAITCLACGSKQKMLKRHLLTAHQLTPAEYRSQFSLPASYPMVAPDYAQQRAELAKRIGLGSRGRGAKGARKPESDGAPEAETVPGSNEPKAGAPRRKASSDAATSADQPKRRARAPKAADAVAEAASDRPKRKRSRTQQE